MQVFNSVDDLIQSSREFHFMDAELITSNIVNCFGNKEIKRYQVLADKYTNPIFSFWIDTTRYVYRYPSDKTLGIIDRETEKIANDIAETLGLDNSGIWMNNDGHKISRYIVNYRFFDYEVKKDIELALDMMHTLHDSGQLTGTPYDIMGEIDRLWAQNKDYATSVFTNIFSIRKAVKSIYEDLDYDNAEKVLCHNDIYARNVLITFDVNYLIDWEFSKDGHPAFDLASLFISSEYSDYEINRILKMYLRHEFDDKIIKEYYSYFAVATLFWLLWAVNLDKNGRDMETEIKQYHKHLMKFIKKVKSLS